MQRQIESKWRPPLWLVIACTIFALLCLPVCGIFLLQWLVPVWGYREAVFLIGIGIIVASFFVGWVLWRILLRPITLLAARADDIRTGQAAALDPLPHYGTSEMQAMGQAMRQMGQVLQGREAVLRSYADHVTHELKSPLSAIQGAAELLTDPKLSEKDRAAMVQNITDATNRMKDLLDAQRDLARANEPLPPGKCKLSDVLPKDADLTVREDGDIALSADAIRPVLSHLIQNARAHGASEILFTVYGNSLTITDNGSGISEGNKERIFDPFFTTRRDEGGTGMGLAIVQRMLEAQGAQISLVDSKGAKFVITF